MLEEVVQENLLELERHQNFPRNRKKKCRTIVSINRNEAISELVSAIASVKQSWSDVTSAFASYTESFNRLDTMWNTLQPSMALGKKGDDQEKSTATPNGTKTKLLKVSCSICSKKVKICELKKHLWSVHKEGTRKYKCSE